MDIEERKKFWDTLISLKGENVETEMIELIKTIKYPDKLYRYRGVNPKNLEDLRTNRMRFSSADYFDDPFDTFLNIDIVGLQQQVYSDIKDKIKLKQVFDFMNTDSFRPYMNDLCLKIGAQFSYDDFLKIFNDNNLDSIFKQLAESRNLLKQDTWSVCFSEKSNNETLWIKYANNYKGYALVYDFKDENSIMCGKQDKCKNCGMSSLIKSLYPIYYSNEKYDATEFVKYIIASTLECVSQKRFGKTLPFKKNT